jgi:hypothetical protein
MNVQVQQDSSMRRTGWWDWSVWLTGSKADLDQIEFVEYVLHPTFSEPVQRRADRSSGFRLKASGWGEFMIHLHLHTRDSKVIKLEHWLRLSESAPSKGAEPAWRGMGTLEVAKGIETPEAGVSRPRLYLSYAVVDAALGDDLREALVTQGFDVAPIDSLVGDQTSEAMRSDPTKRVQAAVFIISDMRNPWLSREVEAARAADFRMVAVTVGEQARVPAELADVPQVHLKDSHEVEYAAPSIADRLWEGGLPH